LKNPKLEASKLIGRWVVFYLVSSLIVGIEAQLSLLPEFIKVGGVMIDVREVVKLLLTFAGTYLDKWKHEKIKQVPKAAKDGGKSYGILPF